MQPHIASHAEQSEYFFKEGCYIVEHWNDAQDPALSIARARLEPGGTTRWHCVRDTIERYQILAGEGLVEGGDRPPTRVGPGDTVVIPAGVRQRIHNPGAGDLIFLALCTPRFEPENYQDLEVMDGNDRASPDQ